MSELKDKVDAATTTTLARRGGDVYSIFQDQLVVRQLAAITGSEEFVKRMLLVAANELRNNPDLAECTRGSFLAALMHAAHLRLEIGGALGHFYLVPFRNRSLGVREVVPILGYRGIIVLARRSQEMSSIAARAVYSADYFDWEYGLQDRLVHRPALDGDRGKIVAFYGVARFVNGGVQPLVMSKAEVDKFKGRSRAADSGKSPWETDYEPMGCKTVIRRMEPYLPLQPEAAQAIQEDEQAEREGRMPHLMDMSELVPAGVPSTGEVAPTAKATRKRTANTASAAISLEAEPTPTDAATTGKAAAVCGICGATEDAQGHLQHDDAKHAEVAKQKREAKAQEPGTDQGNLL